MKVDYISYFKGIDLSERRIPIFIEDSKKPGPVVWICSASHGDEVNGVEVIQRIFSSFEKNPLKKGKVFAIPVINILGFEMSKRYNPYDYEDINRNFPGSEDGNTTERISHAIFQKIKETKPDLVIDIHADTFNSIPYIIIDRPLKNQKTEKIVNKSWDFAEKFGVTVLYDIDIEGYQKYKLDKSLTAALINEANIPAFLVELGGTLVICESFVKIGVKGIKNILANLGMISPEEDYPWVSETKIINNQKMELLEEITGNECGIIKFLVKPGEFVKKGQKLVEIKNIIGEIKENVYAKKDCYIISLMDSSVSFPGSPLLTVASIRKN